MAKKCFVLVAIAAFSVPAFNHATAYTGCSGDLSNTTVVTEYIFHEGGGNTAYNTGTDDGAGDATLTNGVSFSTDVPAANTNCGYSVSLPSTNTPAVETSANYDPLAGASNFTIMAWVKRASGSVSNNTAARIVSDISSLGSPANGFEFRFQGNGGSLTLSINGTERNTTVGGVAANEGNWHHVAVVYDGRRPATNTLTRNVHFYVDGIQRGDGNTLTNFVVSANTNRLTVGNSSVSRTTLQLLVGKIDDVRILRVFSPDAVGDGKTNTTIRCYMNNKDDFEAPNLVCPSNVVVSTDVGQCIASSVVLGTPSVSDNCSGTLTTSNNAPSTFSLGTNTVTWTAIDSNGNVTNCHQTIIVIDNEPPSLTCPAGFTVVSDQGQNYASLVQLGQPVASDNCGISVVSSNAPDQIPVGTNAVVWTVSDGAGNTRTCTQTVVIIDYVIAHPTATVTGSVTICTGASTSIQALLTGASPWILTWADGVITTNSSSPVTRTVSPSATTTYGASLVTGAGYLGTTSGDALITVNQPVQIIGQPLSQAICIGDTATLSVVAAGAAPFAYQWQKAEWGGGAWTLNAGSGALFVGSSTNNNVGDPASNGGGDIDAGGRSWALFNNGGAVTEAIRPFSTAIQVGQILAVDLDNGNNNGVVGFGLQTSNGTNRFELYHRGTSGGGYKILIGNDERDLGIPFTRTGLHVQFLLSSADTYSVTVTRHIDGAVYGPFTGNLTNAPGATIAKLRLFSAGAGSCGFGCNNYTTYFNNIHLGAESESAADAAYVSGWSNGSNGGASYGGVSAATNAALTVSSASATNAGLYRLIVSGSCGGATTSEVASLAVTSNPLTNITVATMVCPTFAGNSASVSDAGPGAGYAWTLDYGSIQEGQGTRKVVWRAGALGTAHIGVTVTPRDGCTANASQDVTLQCPGGTNGLRGDYYNGMNFENLRLSRIDSAVNFDWGTGSPDPLVLSDHFSVRWTGQFVPQYSETYTFYAFSDDGVRLYVNDKLLIDNWPPHVGTTNNATVSLIASQECNIKLEYYDDFGGAAIKLFWSSASQSLQEVPFPLPIPTDSDGNGISDDDETNVYGTDPTMDDTDDDGINDSEELFFALADPNAADFDGTVTDTVFKNAADTNSSTGQWQIDGNEIYALDRRGDVSYAVTLSAADAYRLEIEGRRQSVRATAPTKFDLQVFIDSEYIGRQTLEATDLAYGKIHLYTPWLTPGTHIVRIFWDNHSHLISLRLKSLRVQTLGGPDSNLNGIKDWVETRLHKMSRVETNALTSTFVSPLCLEGRGGWLSMMSLLASGTNIAIHAAPGERLYPAEKIIPPHALERWYANVPLTPNTNSQIVVSYQNGGLVETANVAWVAKNILDGGSLAIRKGDSILFTAAPQGATNGTIGVEIVGITNFSPAVGAPVNYEFNNAGTFTINGTYSGGTNLSGSVTVSVLACAFTNATDCLVQQTRDLDTYDVPNGLVFVSDPRFLKFSESASLTNSGRRFTILIDQNEPRYICTRISTNGPIVSSSVANGIHFYSASQTGMRLVQIEVDGTKVEECVFVASPVISDVTVKVSIIASGVLFEDGTLEKELTASDFDGLGQATVRFYRAASGYTASCHDTEVWQDEVQIGKY